VDSIKINGLIGNREPELEKILADNNIGENFTSDMMRAYLSESTEGDINVEINSMGGDVIQGFEIYDLLLSEKAKGRTVNTYGTAYDSIAFLIFLAGDNRYSVRSASPLIHNSWLHPSQLGDIALNAEVLREIADQNSEADFSMLTEYTRISGRDKMRELQDLMRNETQLTDDQLLEFNFATEIIAPMQAAKAKKLAVSFNSKALKMGADQDLILKSETMSDEVSAIKKKINALLAFVAGSSKNMTLPLEGDGELFIFSEDGEIEGKRAVLAEDGQPTETPAPEGPHRLRDGREIIVGADGVIQSVSEAPSDALAAMELEKEEMATALAAANSEKEEMTKALNAAKSELEKFKTETANQLKALSTEIKALKEVVPGDNETEEVKRFKNFKAAKEDFAKMKPSERRLAMTKASRKN